MIVIGLDLSTSSGVCIFKDGKLIDYTCIKRKVEGNQDSENYPVNYLEMAGEMSSLIMDYIEKYNADFVVIEETNKGRNRYFQKQLEYIHFAMATRLMHYIDEKYIIYMDTSAWRKILSLSLSKDQRNNNRESTQERDAIRQEMSKRYYNKMAREIKEKVDAASGKREANKIIKSYDKEISKMVSNEMRKVRSSVKKVDSKDLAVFYVNENYNLGFKKKDNDIADAICVAESFIKNNYSNKLNKK